jgi:hypothetical protein
MATQLSARHTAQRAPHSPSRAPRATSALGADAPGSVCAFVHQASSRKTLSRTQMRTKRGCPTQWASSCRKPTSSATTWRRVSCRGAENVCVVCEQWHVHTRRPLLSTPCFALAGHHGRAGSAHVLAEGGVEQVRASLLRSRLRVWQGRSDVQRAPPVHRYGKTLADFKARALPASARYQRHERTDGSRNARHVSLRRSRRTSTVQSAASTTWYACQRFLNRSARQHSAPC